jgi:hypothetical protein
MKRNMVFNIRFLILMLSISAGIYGCYPGGPEYTSDFSLVVTDYEQDFNFGAQVTYYMPDTVNFSTNQDIDEDVVLGFEELILNEIASNMSSRGYTRVDSTATEAPDMLVTVQVLAIKNTGVGWVPGPGWWWGYYPPGWGWGGWGGGWYYPPYYPVGYSYSTGTVIINLADPDDEIVEDGEIKLPIKWFAGLDGLLSSTTSTNAQRVQAGINQAFNQSPYLQSNQ